MATPSTSTSKAVLHANVILPNGSLVKAKVSVPSQNYLDRIMIRTMMERWRERLVVLDQILLKEKLSQEESFQLNAEWIHLQQRLQAAQGLFDLISSMDV